jgi:muramoyltetrapeptide carboxypeptidase
MEAGIKVLESWGLKVRVSDQIFADNLLHSNAEQERWIQLKSALMAKDSAAVWCVRGGYGSMKLLPQLSKLKPPREPKAFLGLSDITSLNVFLNQKWKWPVLHAPILSRVGRGDLPTSSIDELKQVLFGDLETLNYELEPLNTSAEKAKRLRGSLVGGNWATIMAGVGTPFQLRPKGSILFLEDVGERGYRLDRFWEQLKQMGFMDQLKGIILGDFTEGDEPDGKNLIWTVLKERAASLRKPVYFGLPSGHGNIQRVLPLGVNCSVQKQNGLLKATAWTGCQK